MTLESTKDRKTVFIILSNSLPKLVHVQVGTDCLRCVWVELSETVTKLGGSDSFKAGAS